INCSRVIKKDKLQIFIIRYPLPQFHIGQKHIYSFNMPVPVTAEGKRPAQVKPAGGCDIPQGGSALNPIAQGSILPRRIKLLKFCGITVVVILTAQETS